MTTLEDKTGVSKGGNAAIAASRTKELGSWCLAKAVTDSPCNAVTSTTVIETSSNPVHHAPWNIGKIVGQKAPFKVKDIWALRVRDQGISVSYPAEDFYRVGYGFPLANRRTSHEI